MSQQALGFEKVAIRPMACLQASKQLLGDRYWLFVGISTVGVLIASIVPFGILAGPMMCGIFLCLFNQLEGKEIRFEDLFKGFDYFVESLIATLILMGVMLVVIVPTYIIIVFGMIGIGSSDNDSFTAGLVLLMVLLYLFIIVVTLLIYVCFCFTYPLIVDRGLKAIPAIKTSVRAAIANFGGVLGLVLVCSVVSLLAALLCYLPMFLVMPLIFGAVAIAYRKVFPELPTTEQST